MHAFSGTAVQSDCNSNWIDLTSTANDDSGYTLNVAYESGTPYTVTSRSGVVRNPPRNQPTGNATITDSNGNQITASNNGSTTTFTDTLGFTALTVSGTLPTISYQYTAPNSQQVSFTVNYTNYTVRTNFGCSGVNEGNFGTVALVSSINLPGGGQYSFAYEQTPGYGAGNVTGRIASVTLPTGGTVSYSYTGGSNGTICADGSVAGLTRTVNPGGAWTYTRSGSDPSWSTYLTDPQGAQTVYQFQKDTNSSNYYETKRRIYQTTSGPLLQTIVTCYDGTTAMSNCPTATVSSPILRKRVYPQLPDTSGRVSEVDTQYNSYGLPTEVDEYDFGTWGSGNPSSSPLRKTITSYASLGAIVDHPSEVDVYDGQSNFKARTAYSYDQAGVTAPQWGTTPQHISVSGSRGNLTTVARWVQGSTWLSQGFSYYDTGLVNSSTDVNGAVTSYYYNSSNCPNSLPTSVNLPLSLTRSTAWNCNGGVVTSTTDENNQQTTLTYGDSAYWRVTTATYPDGGQTSYTYSTGSSTPWSVTTNRKIDSTPRYLTTTEIYDGLGRSYQQQLTSDPEGTVYTDTTYDNMGRVHSVSNPYRTTNDQTYGITTYTYDALNRVTQVLQPDTTSTVLYTYNAAAVSVQDEGNGTSRVQRISHFDGLGRLIYVCEVTATALMGSPSPADCQLDVAGSGYRTDYQYDTLNNLKQVTQPNLNARTYTYDGLSRLTSETNPESCCAAYTYNSSGDLIQRETPMPNQSNAGTKVYANYNYDALHRLTQIAYSDGTTPTVNYYYDQTSAWGSPVPNPKGHLTSEYVSNGGGTLAANLFYYDAMGRRTLYEECTPANCAGNAYATQYSYDLMGNMVSYTNGEGVTFYPNYNTAARLTSLTTNYVNSTHPGTLFSNAHYNAMSELSSATLGNGINVSYSYFPRGWLYAANEGPYQITAMGYYPNGLVGSSNDNNIMGYWTYTYDDFNRLKTAGKSGQSFAYVYDRFGNRWQQNVTSGSGPNPTYNFDANNHISGSGVVYDAAGNVTSDGVGHTYTYDAESRLTKVDNGSTATYLYDAESRRVRVTNSSGTLDLLYDLAGRVITAIQPSPLQWVRTEIYVGNKHLAIYADGTTYFVHSDWLGTERVRTTLAGSSYESIQNLPFGDGYTWGPTTDPSLLHFTGQWHDWESNTDHFWFRQFTPTQGRWMTPDPAGMAAVDPGIPQSWNRYAYVMNSPINYVDPLGLDCENHAQPDANGNCPGVPGDLPNRIQTNAWGYIPWDQNHQKEIVNFPSRFGNLWYAGGGFSPFPVGEGGAGAGIGAKQIPRPPTSDAVSSTSGYRQEFCNSQSDIAFWAKVLPGGEDLFGHNFTSEAAAAAGIDIAVDSIKDHAIDTAAKSTGFLLAVRSWFRVPMSITSRFLAAYGYGSSAYTLYKGMKAMQSEYKYCMTN